jgi:hypothetical protein
LTVLQMIGWLKTCQICHPYLHVADDGAVHFAP